MGSYFCAGPEDPELCASCGKRMKVLAAITSPHQDGVIERILKARGEWAPPWRRERRARSPPRQLEIFTQPDDEFSQEIPEAEDEFSQVTPDDGGDDL